jgi:uncharacterized OB-fold protein
MLADRQAPPRMEPPVTELTQLFWDATRDKSYLVQRCSNCGRAVAFPRVSCPFCASTHLTWQPASGKGTLYSFTIDHKQANPIEGASGPYVVAMIDLEEGARVMSNLVNCPLEACKPGMSVSVTWEALSDGRNLPIFEPVLMQAPAPSPAEQSST